jgi:hypothetical protein
MSRKDAGRCLGKPVAAETSARRITERQLSVLPMENQETIVTALIHLNQPVK